MIQLATGAWFDPLHEEDGTVLCKHGNPNVLTRDEGTSKLAQGPTAHSTLVEVAKYSDVLPVVKAHEAPNITNSK